MYLLSKIHFPLVFSTAVQAFALGVSLCDCFPSISSILLKLICWGFGVFNSYEGLASIFVRKKENDLKKEKVQCMYADRCMGVSMLLFVSSCLTSHCLLPSPLHRMFACNSNSQLGVA